MKSLLKIDNKSLEDLDILPDNRPFSLLNLLNSRAKTTDAKQILKNTILSPLGNIEEILDKQADIIFVIENIEKLLAIQFDDRIIYSCKDYLNSNIIAISTPNRLVAFVNSWGYSKYIQTLTIGIQSMLTLLHEIAPLANISQSNSPKSIQDILKSISIYMKEVEKYSIYTKKSLESLSNIDILILDSVFRKQLLEQSKKLLEALSVLDAFIALAKFNIDFKLEFPIFIESKNLNPSVQIESLRHIAISQCIPNSIQIGESFNVIYLTGPNMSGKSSFLKAFGWAVFLAHLGMGVPAKRMSLTIFDEIISDINNEDSIAEGQSYFLSEVRRVKTIAEKVVSPKKVLVICDELFKGTNVIDASDCTHVLIDGFALRKNSIFLIASHIHDIKSNILNSNAIGWFQFESSINQGKPVYSYLLQEGISDQRHGLLILRNEGVCDLLLNKKSISI